MPNQIGSGQVEYGTCPVCGYVMLPVLPLSPCGHDQQPVLSTLSESGVVYSWTRVWVGKNPEGQILAMADFLDGRLRVTAPVLEASEIEIGARVEITTGIDTPLALRRAP